MKTPRGMCMSAGPYRRKMVDMDAWTVYEIHNTKTGGVRYQVRGESTKCKHALNMFVNEEDAKKLAEHAGAKKKGMVKEKYTPKPKKSKKKSKKGGACPFAAEGGAKKKAKRKSKKKASKKRKTSKKRKSKKSTKRKTKRKASKKRKSRK